MTHVLQLFILRLRLRSTAEGRSFSWPNIWLRPKVKIVPTVQHCIILKIVGFINWVPDRYIKKPCGGIFEPCLACPTEDCQQIGSVSLKCTAILLLSRVSTFVAEAAIDYFWISCQELVLLSSQSCWQLIQKKPINTRYSGYLFVLTYYSWSLALCLGQRQYKNRSQPWMTSK